MTDKRYLVWHCPESKLDPDALAPFDHYKLRPGLTLVDSGLSRSKLYHRVKWALSDDSELLVAPLSDDPKFKGMSAGALKWVRRDTQ